MKTVAYLRVSTTRQDVQGQRLAILEYARRHGLHVDEFVEATASARTSPKRRRLDDLMSVLESGDRLVVSELSRLGRSLGQIVAMLDTLASGLIETKRTVTFIDSAQYHCRSDRKIGFKMINSYH